MAPTKPAVAAGKAAPKAAPQRKQQLRGKANKKKKVSLKFIVDCTHPVEDSIMDTKDFLEYLKTRIKINGKANNFAPQGKQHVVSLTREKETKIILNSEVPFSKRYVYCYLKA
ncbi:hypothetical protein ABEB36_006886 [Hypothenemus hampei]|uniref:Large ribosomal subunit protein eL22 n=1 Tax=Hypothenemus hampei TaxID=57062 RepID=A0ABD1ES28_HYPHA